METRTSPSFLFNAQKKEFSLFYPPSLRAEISLVFQKNSAIYYQLNHTHTIEIIVKESLRHELNHI